jgi:chemotaxis family two-component system response regulator Rcp1
MESKKGGADIIMINVLMIEDNPDDVFLAQEALKEFNAPVNMITVENGLEAILFLRQKDKYKDVSLPDLILLDLNLPKKNGRQVLAEIKRDEKISVIPVIIITTSDSKEDIIQSYLLHANCYITKPVNLDSFIMILKNIVNFWFTIVKLPDKLIL